MATTGKASQMWIIRKFHLSLTDHQSVIITMPIKAKILSLQDQWDLPTLWALVKSNDSKLENRKFVKFKTDSQLPKNQLLEFVGTYQNDTGTTEFHIFEDLSKQ